MNGRVWARMRRAGQGDQGAGEKGGESPAEGLTPVTGPASCGRVIYIVEWLRHGHEQQAECYVYPPATRLPRVCVRRERQIHKIRR